MVKRFSAGAALLAFALAGAAGAAPDVVVEAVQMPAWVERDGAKIPLAPGMELRNRDELRTGPNSRLLLMTADGSWIKLGERASLTLDGLQVRKDNVFQAALKVAEGAFRFTTEVLKRARGKREVNITVATVTAGIRGTDLWGKSSPGRQIVCLIEGKVEVTPPGGDAIPMDSPMSFYVREDGRSQPVALVSRAQIALWALETETQSGEGVAERGGKWKITAVSGKSLSDALEVGKALRDAGYPAEIQPAKIKDRRVYDVRLSNFKSKGDAEFVVRNLRQQGALGKYGYKVGM